MHELNTDTATVEIKELLSSGDQRLWNLIRERTIASDDFVELRQLLAASSRARKRGIPVPWETKRIKLALIGAYTFEPLLSILKHLAFAWQIEIDALVGNYDDYVSQILNPSSELNTYRADFVLFWPPSWRFRYNGDISDSSEQVLQSIAENRQALLSLCDRIHDVSGAEVIFCNFIPPSHHDSGPLRIHSPGSEWNYFRALNTELAIHASPCVHICDIELLSARWGSLKAMDARAWFESKQPCSVQFIPQVCKEIVHILRSVNSSPKKVLVTDLDETLWGGAIGEDGLDGIELGSTTARGEAFLEFQSVLKRLSQRGVILAACSKNDISNAALPFEHHPEMVLRRSDFAAFKANWRPKSENIRDIASDLSLGLDSFVFIDDNPAEVELVKRFVPEVTSICLGSDPSVFSTLLIESRLFDVRKVTSEDRLRTSQYNADSRRRFDDLCVTDMNAYLQSLEMTCDLSYFVESDVPRLTQLINKSNQFNLTTRRRSESEVRALLHTASVCISARLKDRFGDCGLISLVIATPLDSKTIEIDSWLMSCRVLKRGVEHALMNEFMRVLSNKGFECVQAVYRASGKNSMVKNFYDELGFSLMSSSEDCREYIAHINSYKSLDTNISVNWREQWIENG